MSTPKHPAVVHFSITTTLLTGALDAAHFLFHYGPTSAAVGSIYKTLDIQLNPDLFPLFSYYTTILTIVFAVPAVMTGAAELMPLIKRDGLGSPKAKVGIAHAMINDVTVLAAVFNWWTRRNVPMFIPSTTNILVSSLLALPATMFAAHLGGSLVYNYGMGLRIGQTAKSKKGQ